MAKKIAVYGTYETVDSIPIRQRYWKRRKAYSYGKGGKTISVPAGKQRYWKTVERLMKVEKKGRYEFTGKGKELYKAVVKAHRIVPKGYVTVKAEDFLESPEDYGVEGEWIDREVESH